ncbi:AP-2 adaptor complex subunit sigma [Penicillium waksmanii]|uniref:AP-2 adaptor complex subunit sigma n=1 Tax=Penicillium waksmanii TaxID=69791 RepID=UPI0025477D92|nr:AP-2 adaptor complex subunit sigma [Penicillium waksmanii]KAJ5989037.1 AP-2 adaptor complex subunit sigma [Penicillium waksmanii]
MPIRAKWCVPLVTHPNPRLEVEFPRSEAQSDLLFLLSSASPSGSPLSPPKEKAKIIKDVTQLVLSRRTRMCNFLEYKDSKVVYRRYASLFFIAGCSSTDNELITLEVVHRYVEQMDKYYGNVCELDIIFNFQKAYFILDELLLAGELQESSKKNVLRCISQQDSLEDMEDTEDVTRNLERVGL